MALYKYEYYYYHYYYYLSQQAELLQQWSLKTQNNQEKIQNLAIKLTTYDCVQLWYIIQH